nr:hypothetical protein [Moritella viscosa]SHO14736.1 DNA primase [Moritella viscosa]
MREYLGSDWIVTTNLFNKSKWFFGLQGAMKCYEHEYKVLEQHDSIICSNHNEIVERNIKAIKHKRKVFLIRINLFVPIHSEETNEKIEDIAETFLQLYVENLNTRKTSNIDLETMKKHTLYVCRKGSDFTQIRFLIPNRQNEKFLRLSSHRARCSFRDAYEKVVGQLPQDKSKTTNKDSK